MKANCVVESEASLLRWRMNYGNVGYKTAAMEKVGRWILPS
jgi:hypothetical protein